MCVWPHSVGNRACFLCTYSADQPHPLPSRSTRVCCFPADGNLYAVGGYDSSSHLATVEKYEPQVHNAPQ